MDRCYACKSQTYFYGLQTRPVKARWVVCYDCRGARNASGSKDVYMFMTDLGYTGLVNAKPSNGFFATGKEVDSGD